ncbi:MAG: hypothetical protein HRU03_06510 [Nanoarchaeales archaeon]|nr:hypothetical protein [Nanoarchaeales archaeon]
MENIIKTVPIDKAKKCDIADDIYLNLILEDSNLTKISMKILYLIEMGFKNFLIDFELGDITISTGRVLVKTRKQIFSLVNSHKINILIKGFSQCVFNRRFMPANLGFDFSNYIKLIPTERNKDDINCSHLICLADCVDRVKINKYEQIPLYGDSDIIKTYENKFQEFWNKDLIDISKKCLLDYIENSAFESRKIFFRERISIGSDDFKEGFNYRIFNKPESFEEIYKFMREIYGARLDRFKDFLKQSSSFTLGFEILADNVLQKSIFFSTIKFPKSDVENILFNLDISLKSLDNIYGVNLNLTDGTALKEVFYFYEEIDSFKGKRFFDRFDLEAKMPAFKYLNSTTKPIKNILVRDEYKDEEFVSRKLDIGCGENLIKTKSIGVLFKTSVAHIMDEDMSSLILEVSKYAPTKIIFNYSPSLPIRIPLEREEYIEE